jgi:hypothetical protein
VFSLHSLGDEASRTEDRSAPVANRITRPLIALAIIYLLTHVSGLSRELVTEEGMFMMPGRVFFETGRFTLFHKPPLTTLLLGALSFAGGYDPFVGGRLVPFLVGFFVCALPLVLTRSWVISAVALAAPFLFAASSHMQTDPTVGLLGYGLVAAGVFVWFRSEGAGGGAALVSGLVILWLGKLEIAIIASAALCLTLFMDAPARRRLSKTLVLGTVAGVVSFVLLTWILGATSGTPFSESVGEVVHTVTRISGDLASDAASASDLPGRKRAMLWYALRAFKADVLFGILLLVLAAGELGRAQGTRRNLLARWALLPLVVVPIAVYFLGAYAGDGFPRYFLIVFPPLLLMAGDRLETMPAPFRRPAVALVLGLSCLMLLPETYSLWRSPGSVNVRRGIEGYRRAALFVEAWTRPGDLILAPEAAVYYVPGREWMVEESFAPYPWLYARVLSEAPSLRAAIVPRLPPPPNRYSTILGRLVQSLDERGGRRYAFGSFEVIVLDPAPDGRPSHR